MKKAFGLAIVLSVLSCTVSGPPAAPSRLPVAPAAEQAPAGLPEPIFLDGRPFPGPIVFEPKVPASWSTELR